MSLELKMLALSIVLGLVQILLSAHSASLQVGYHGQRSPGWRAGSSERFATSWRPFRCSLRRYCWCK